MSNQAASGDEIGIGVIGLGTRISHVLQCLLNQDKRLRVRAVFDPNPQSIEKHGKALQPGFTVHDSYEKLVRDPQIQWVMIGSWNRFHAEHAIAAMNAGKNVFCEKPLATGLEDGLAVREAVRRTGRVFSFGLVLRYSPHYQRIRSLLSDKRIGKLVSFEFNETLHYNHGGYIFGNWRRQTANAGSHVLEKCCHDLDLANWLTGSLPVRVASFGGRDIFRPENAGLVDRIGPDSTGNRAFESWADPDRVDPFKGDTDLLDNQVVIMEYANGVRATFHTNASAAIHERRFYLLGTEGAIRADASAGTIEVQRLGPDHHLEADKSGPGGGHSGGDEILGAGLAATMLQGKPPAAGIDEALRSAAVAFAIDQAQSTGQVVDLRPTWERIGIRP